MHCLHVLPCCRFPAANGSFTNADKVGVGGRVKCSMCGATDGLGSVAHWKQNQSPCGTSVNSGSQQNGALPDCIHPRRIVPETRRSLGCRKRGT